MKKLFHIIFLVLAVTACHNGGQTSTGASDGGQMAAEAPLAEGAAIVFDTIYFDLGSLAIDGPDETRDFVFTNKGSEPLVIKNVETSCPCLAVDYPTEAIAPNQKSKITMRLIMSELGSGQFYRSALVYTTASDEPTEIIFQGIKNYE